MKAPSDGGLQPLQRGSTSSSPINETQSLIRRNLKRRKGESATPRSSVLSNTLEFLALSTTFLTLVLCFASKHLIQRYTASGAELFDHPKVWQLPLAVFACSTALVAACACFYTSLFRSRISGNRMRQRMLGLILLLPALYGLMLSAEMVGANLFHDDVGTTIAAATITASCLLFATVIGRTVSTLVAIGLCTVLYFLGISEIAAIWAVGVSSIVGQYSAKALRNRSAVIRAAAITMTAAGITGFVIKALEVSSIGSACVMGMQSLLTGCLGAAIWFTLLTIMERPYELSTPLGLLELLDPTRPILEKFAREAPGTFAHSIMVGHLAASAADSIGADALLCRVAAQYHDIGKLNRAQFFKENQPDGVNVHDRLNPSLSAIVVNSHVKDGERIAKELGLPSSIRDIITQHHGTTLMRYFYYRASSGSAPRFDDPLQYQFRYSGPKPQTKEAAIMMLADSIEAASRTLLNPTPESVDLLIAGIISDRVQDHQLDECPITIKDMSKIRSSFAHVLCAMMHQRVEYPCSQSDQSEDILTEPVTQIYLDTRSSALQNPPFDFYEDFDPSVLCSNPIGRFDQPIDSEPQAEKTPNKPVRKPKNILTQGRENPARRFGGGVKRSHNR